MLEQRQLLFGLHLDPFRMNDVITRCRSALVTRKRLLIGVVNAAKIVNIQRDAMLRDSMLECDVVVADGQSLVWASRLLGRPLPERVAGIDVFEELLRVANEDRLSIYLLGGSVDVVREIVGVVRGRYRDLTIAGFHDGYFQDDDSAAIADDIRKSGPDMLFVGITSPKKEVFLGRFGSMIGVPILHGVGGSFDIIAGRTKRAPLIWQQAGLEWAYRLFQEPRRLWRRYLTTNTIFLWLTLCEWFEPTRAFKPVRRRDVVIAGSGSLGSSARSPFGDRAE